MDITPSLDSNLEPRRRLSEPKLEQIVHTALGSRRISEIHPLTDGYRNANFKIEFANSSEPVVLRLYEHDPILCRKEVDIMRLVSSSVPVPEIIYAQTDAASGLPPLTVTRFIEGISVRDLRHTADDESLREAGYSLGQTLAAIGRFTFKKSGWISAGLSVTRPLLEGENPVPRFVDLCLKSPNLQRRVPPELCDQVHELMWRSASELAELDSQTHLVHSDWSHRNLLVQRIDGRWKTAAVLDWEFAISYSPLADIGHFLLRHERRSMDVIEPAFIKGYLDGGGGLPDDWRRLARLVDLTAVCEGLTHTDLPEAALNELLALLNSGTGA